MKLPAAVLIALALAACASPVQSFETAHAGPAWADAQIVTLDDAGSGEFQEEEDDERMRFAAS